jgi:hypothetical protein
VSLLGKPWPKARKKAPVRLTITPSQRVNNIRVSAIEL